MSGGASGRCHHRWKSTSAFETWTPSSTTGAGRNFRAAAAHPVKPAILQQANACLGPVDAHVDDARLTGQEGASSMSIENCATCTAACHQIWPTRTSCMVTEGKGQKTRIDRTMHRDLLPRIRLACVSNSCENCSSRRRKAQQRRKQCPRPRGAPGTEICVQALVFTLPLHRTRSLSNPCDRAKTQMRVLPCRSQDLAGLKILSGSSDCLMVRITAKAGPPLFQEAHLALANCRVRR